MSAYADFWNIRLQCAEYSFIRDSKRTIEAIFRQAVKQSHKPDFHRQELRQARRNKKLPYGA